MKYIKQHKYILFTVLVSAGFLMSLYYTRLSTVEFEEEVVEEEICDDIGPVYQYGLHFDPFTVIRGKIKPNQYLSDILLKHHLAYPEIHELVEKAQKVYRPKDMRVGNKYCVLASNDSIAKARYFIYEISPVDYVVFDIGDSLRVYREQKEVKVIERVLHGTINSSLYGTLQDLGADASLAVMLAEIYAWTIDFYRIQKGDGFSVYFEESYVEGKSVGITRVRGAKFLHKGTDVYAIEFEQDGRMSYFDLEGNGLKKAFLKAPLKFSRISSGFTMKRFHPVQKRFKAHLGTDYAAPTGTPIMTVGDGEVVEARYSQFNGNYVKVRHNGTYTTQYLHMSKIAKGMKPGRRVSQGEVIGYVGSTGLATGPHVCFRFWKNNKQVNHLAEKFPSAEPVNKSLRGQFEQVRDAYLLKLRQDTTRVNIPS